MIQLIMHYYVEHGEHLSLVLKRVQKQLRQRFLFHIIMSMATFKYKLVYNYYWQK